MLSLVYHIFLFLTFGVWIAYIIALLLVMGYSQKDMTNPPSYLSKLITDVSFELWDKRYVALLEEKHHDSFGDFSSTIAFGIAKYEDQDPLNVAQKLVDALENKKDPYIADIQIAGKGFINIFLSNLAFEHTFKALQKETAKDFVLPKKERGDGPIIIEFSSPNVAKPMHMGHLRNTLLGDFLARLYSFVGYNVVRWNHLGDWGTQFGALITAYKKGWTTRDAVEKDPIGELVAIYVRFHKEAETDTSLQQAAREEFKKLEEGDRENVSLLEWFRKESLLVFDHMYKALGVSFDVIAGESAYVQDMHAVIAKLKEENIAQESQGALIVPLEDKGLGSALIQKSDGATLYMTRDIASLLHRIKVYNPKAILYVVGEEQSLHFKQLFAIAHKMNVSSTLLEHVGYGLVLSAQSGKKLSTRAGVDAGAKSALEGIVQSARTIVDEKQPLFSSEQKESTAIAVGVGALRFSMLKDSRTSPISFDPKKALSLENNSSVYVQYTYARFSRILDKADIKESIDVSLFEDADRMLIKKIWGFEKALTLSLAGFSSHHIAQYLFELTTQANAYYESVPILSDTNTARMSTRLALLRVLLSRIEWGLSLFGIDALSAL